MNEVLIGATDNVVIRHSNGIYTATRCLQDMDAVKGPNVPDLGKSVTYSQARHVLTLGLRTQQPVSEHVGG